MKFSLTKAISMLTLLFMLMAIISLVAINKLQHSVSVGLASSTASVLASTINQARVSYSKNVVGALRAHPDISVLAQYQTNKYEIPNPATFAIELGEVISAPEKGLILHTFSNYPFDSRQHNRGPQDNFQKAALENLTATNSVFERIEMLNEMTVFRRAEAIFMQESCVDCHNSHPDSPKKDWRVGDIRGAIDISIPLDGDNKHLSETVQYAYIIFIASSVIGLLCLFVTLKRAINLSAELEKKVETRTKKLNYLARMDSLTSIANRRHFEEYSLDIFAHQNKNSWPMALVVYDLDYFKNVNDSYGHDIGDECLKAVVNSVNFALRSNKDFHARIGGEEFAIILQGISSEDLKQVIERILTNVSSVIIKANVDVKVTCSIGYTLATSNDNVTMKKMMNIADKALYKAKANGRNQACHLPYNDTQ